MAINLRTLLCFFALGLGLNAFKVKGGTNSIYWINAQKVHDCVVGKFLTSCKSYRVEPVSTAAYEWYCVSQIDADAAMAEQGDTKYAACMNDAYTWMSNFWDAASPEGGYVSSANFDGSNVGKGKYTDDNSLAGNVYLDCYAVSSGAAKTNYLNSAMATANWLMFSGQWDKTFGGGFWWDTTKQNKPTQSNGLAMELFSRLYQITGKNYYKGWANSVKNWLETRMYDHSDGLYVWQIETNGTSGGIRRSTEFTYDNAIMIEANLAYSRAMSNHNYQTKAQHLARSLNTKLWNAKYGSYYFNTADGRVNPCWCGWASQSLIKLYQVDGDTNWLNYARQNIDFMNRHLKDDRTGGYYQFCNMDGSKVESKMEGVDQAWMQRTQALLSEYR